MSLADTLFGPLHLRLMTAADLEPPPTAPADGQKNTQLTLERGRVHEFFAAPLLSANTGIAKNAAGLWEPPLTVMVALASRLATSTSPAHTDRIVFIGRRVWPTFQMLAAALTLNADIHPAEAPAASLRRCLFLDPLTDKERFWALGEALRCPGVNAIIGDGSGMNATVSRRLQLAAETGGALTLLGRPWWERDSLAWAATQWMVRPRAGPSAGKKDPARTDADEPVEEGMKWELELVRSRGHRADGGQDARRFWNVEWRYRVFRGTGAFDLSAVVGCGTGAQTESQERRSERAAG